MDSGLTIGNQNLEQSPIVTTDAKPLFFALVIGIDNYQCIERLYGAASDADAVAAYLEDRLSVPKERIRNLRNEDATREAIIQSFHDLQKDDRINKGDTIFIYFAGHGTEKEAPDGWHTERNMVQLIIPQDADTELPSGRIVNPIPDRTIAVLLEKLAHEKGNNIVVALDCCHSSSGSRSAEDDTGSIARHAKVKGDLSLDLDRDILDSGIIGRNAITLPIFLQHGLRSHVLLAACGAKENAFETRGHGDFTAALLKTLSEIDGGQVTYRDLVEKMSPLPRQTPHCEGYYKDSFLFDAMVPSADSSFIPVIQENNTYTLRAGLAHGITVGSEFALYADRTGSISNAPLCILRVTLVKDTQATLAPLPDTQLDPPLLSSPAFARQVRYGAKEKLAVYFGDPPSGMDVKGIVDAAIRSGNVDIGVLEKAEQEAELMVHFLDDGGEVNAAFSTGIQLAKNHGLERLPYVVKANADNLSRVLRSVARWNWHFRRQGSKAFQEKLHLEFYRLEHVNEEYDEQQMPIMTQVGEDMIHDDVVELVVDPDNFFGVRIVNDTERDLYPYLFYFDVSDQSIEPYSTVGDQAESPLPAGASLTIGYGATGDVPFAFKLRDGVDVDVGFLKVFFTTSPTDFRPLKQASPFMSGRGPVSKEQLVSRLKAQNWGTAMIAVVQRRAPE